MSNRSELFSGFPLAFDHGIAKECGVNAAIVLNHIIYWLKYNEKHLYKNPECEQDGKIWMYETQKEMAEFFEFFSEKEVRDYLKILVDKELLVKGNFNKNHFEKKNWYSLPDDVFKKVFSKRQIRLIDTDLAVSSEETNSSHVHIYEEEEKINAGLAGSENQEILYYQGRNAKLMSITKSEIFASLGGSGFEAAVISAAIKKFCERKGKVGDPIKLITLMCEDMKRQNKKVDAPKESVYKELKNPTKLKLR